MAGVDICGFSGVLLPVPCNSCSANQVFSLYFVKTLPAITLTHPHSFPRRYHRGALLALG